MSAALKAPQAKAVVRADVIECTAGINIAAMDANVLLSSITDRLEHFEYRDVDKQVIDALYTFTRLLGTAIETIKDRNSAIERMICAPGGVA